MIKQLGREERSDLADYERRKMRESAAGFVQQFQIEAIERKL